MGFELLEGFGGEGLEAFSVGCCGGVFLVSAELFEVVFGLAGLGDFTAELGALVGGGSAVAAGADLFDQPAGGLGVSVPTLYRWIPAAANS